MRNVNEFTGGVSLLDTAWAEDNALGAGTVQLGAVAAISNAFDGVDSKDAITGGCSQQPSQLVNQPSL